MEDALDSFASAGVNFAGVEIGAPGFGAPPIAIERDGEDTGKGFRQVAGVALAALALIALGAGAFGGMTLYQAQIERDRLERRTGELAAELRNAGRAVSGSGLVAEANRLHDRKREEPPAVMVLKALSELLPDSVWLTGLSAADGKVTLNGRGQNVPPLVGLLESSPLFRDVIFSSAVQRNPETGQDEFAITATIEPGGGRP